MNNNFEDIVKEIYFQIKNVKDTGAEPYYLFMAEELYVIMKVEMGKKNNVPDAKLEFFDGLEVVHMRGMTVDYIEVRGIRTKHAI